MFTLRTKICLATMLILAATVFSGCTAIKNKAVDAAKDKGADVAEDQQDKLIADLNSKGMGVTEDMSFKQGVEVIATHMTDKIKHDPMNAKEIALQGVKDLGSWLLSALLGVLALWLRGKKEQAKLGVKGIASGVERTPEIVYEAALNAGLEEDAARAVAKEAKKVLKSKITEKLSGLGVHPETERLLMSFGIVK